MPTSLEKSHSKSSNAKLTLICLLLAISFPLLFFGIACWIYMASKFLGVVITILSALVTLFSLFLLNKFSRG